jgi:hypothetical protein
MEISTHSKMRQQRREANLSSSLTYDASYVCHPEPGRTLSANGGEGSAFRSYGDSPTEPKKLDFGLTYRKQRTNYFLIDNFRWSSAALSDLAKATYDFFNRHYVRLELLVSCRKQRTGPLSNRHKFAFCNPGFLSFPGQSLLTSNLRHPTSRTSNRQSPELELPLSHRKQRADDFLIANFGALPSETRHD